MWMKEVLGTLLATLLMQGVRSDEEGLSKSMPAVLMDVWTKSGAMFHVGLTPRLFSWPNISDDNVLQPKSSFTYSAVEQGSPFMPAWMHYVYSQRHQKGFLYGTPVVSSNSTVILDILALNEMTKKYGLLQLLLHVVVEDGEEERDFRITFKVDNLNLVDVFDDGRVDRLKRVLRSSLSWPPSSSKLYWTNVEEAASSLPHYRYRTKTKVVLQLMSSANFSSELISLKKEIDAKLRFHGLTLCSPNFSLISVEADFRLASVAVDWCSLRLHVEVDDQWILLEDLLSDEDPDDKTYSDKEAGKDPEGDREDIEKKNEDKATSGSSLESSVSSMETIWLHTELPSFLLHVFVPIVTTVITASVLCLGYRCAKKRRKFNSDTVVDVTHDFHVENLHQQTPIILQHYDTNDTDNKDAINEGDLKTETEDIDNIDKLDVLGGIWRPSPPSYQDSLPRNKNRNKPKKQS